MRRFFLSILVIFAASTVAQALSFDLDSIRQWGRFPRFVVDTYRWGDHFFNGYDTTYVKGTGYKFNVKTRADSWVDYYNFDLPENMRMRMLSDPSTSVGFYLSYLAVSIGYDQNISKYFGGNSKGRDRFTFGFNCSLFAVDAYYVSNKGGTHISKFGPRGNTHNPHLDFDGIHTTSAGLDLYYFFNHKRYSQGAAFSFGRIQLQSQGSFYGGFSYWHQNFDFDFAQLPDYMKDALPSSWPDYRYHAEAHNYLLKGGYGYNWVPHRRWCLAISESPMIGIKYGAITNAENEIKYKTTFAMYNDLRMSVVWNSGRWFIGAVGDFNIGLIYDKDSTFANAILSGSISAGCRFNLW